MHQAASPSGITEAGFRDLVGARAITSVTAIGAPGGFSIALHCGASELILSATRGGARMFASLDTAAAFLKRLGISQFSVDASGHELQLLRKPRPDRAEALRRTRTRPQQQTLFTNNQGK